TLAIGSQTGHGSPILSTTRSTAHSCSSPPGAGVLRAPCPEFSRQRSTGSWLSGRFSKFNSIASCLHLIRTWLPCKCLLFPKRNTQHAPAWWPSVQNCPSNAVNREKSRKAGIFGMQGTGQGNGGSSCAASGEYPTTTAPSSSTIEL